MQSPCQARPSPRGSKIDSEEDALVVDEQVLPARGVVDLAAAVAHRPVQLLDDEALGDVRLIQLPEDLLLLGRTVGALAVAFAKAGRIDGQPAAGIALVRSRWFSSTQPGDSLPVRISGKLKTRCNSSLPLPW